MQLTSFFKMQGLSEEEAKSRIYLVDSQGLIFNARGPLAEHKKSMYLHTYGRRSSLMTCYTVFSRNDYQGPPMTNLVDIINFVKPTALLGLSTIKVFWLTFAQIYRLNLFPECIQPTRH